MQSQGWDSNVIDRSSDVANVHEQQSSSSKLDVLIVQALRRFSRMQLVEACYFMIPRRGVECSGLAIKTNT